MRYNVSVFTSSQKGQSGYSGVVNDGNPGYSGYSGYIFTFIKAAYIADATAETIVTQYNALMQSLKTAGLIYFASPS
jgi:hypothetical protein